MLKIGIIGSGFGLYGYLPALIKAVNTKEIQLVERYKEKMQSREDLKVYLENVSWVKSESDLFSSCKSLVIAVNPKLQEFYIDKMLSDKNSIEQVFLEKPVATTPRVAQKYLDQFHKMGVRVRIGYLFRYTGWGRLLLSAMHKKLYKSPIKIEWKFNANHFKQDLVTWKKNIDLGGGVISFYGIHLIALLAEVGYQEVVSSETFHSKNKEEISWRAKFRGDLMPELCIELDSKSELQKFQIKSDELLIEYSDPFDIEKQSQNFDKRISPLIGHIKSFEQVDKDFSWYKDVNNLWQRIINRNKCILDGSI